MLSPVRLLAILGMLAALALAAPAAAARTPAIVGGDLAGAEEFPWAASIQWVAPDGFFEDRLDGQDDVVPVCTGSLIGERWVLTAGHCVLAFGSVLGSPSSVATLGVTLSFQIVIGQANIDDPAPENVYPAQADDVIALEPQAGGGLVGDLALIRLPRPAPRQAIRIPGAGQEAKALTAPGAPATVVGWGVTSEGAPDTSDELRKVEVPIVSDAECRKAYPTLEVFGYRIGFDATTMLCAGLPRGGKDACQGDSGGPLMAPAAGGWVQIGVTSWGEGCARSGKPGVYSRLSGLFGWIVNNLAGDPVAPAGPPSTSTAAVRARRKSGVITGSVNPNGLATSVVIELGPTRRYGTGRVESYAGAGSSPVEVSGSFGSLKPGTTYHYRITATNVAGVRSTEGTFTTPVRRPRR